mmetsp:Transcript_18152/g.55621  ORF Transcript_18152/g.55621 Transcript_18152/m.55621 type:complete len:208 (-) Transcript_18152:1701-2324(-)
MLTQKEVDESYWSLEVALYWPFWATALFCSIACVIVTDAPPPNVRIFVSSCTKSKADWGSCSSSRSWQKASTDLRTPLCRSQMPNNLEVTSTRSRANDADSHSVPPSWTTLDPAWQFSACASVSLPLTKSTNLRIADKRLLRSEKNLPPAVMIVPPSSFAKASRRPVGLGFVTTPTTAAAALPPKRVISASSWTPRNATRPSLRKVA